MRSRRRSSRRITSDQEIFYALLEALCTRILKESNPAGLAQHVIDILRANFPPTEH
jgi:hypothetical protein